MTVCTEKPEADARLLRPPNLLHDIAKFWGDFFNLTMPINWQIRFMLELSAPAKPSE